MIPLTKVEGVPHRADVIPGMAYFAGTGPADTTCKTCAFRGYHRKSRFGNWYHTNGCEKFRVLSGGKHGARLRPGTSSCKYYEAK
jgi:hypothetical protein